MRLLLTSDLHYKLRQYDWLIGMAAKFDVVVVAGDLQGELLGADLHACRGQGAAVAAGASAPAWESLPRTDTREFF